MKNTMRNGSVLVFLLGAAACISGCVFDPPNGLLICASAGKACPDGYECASDQRCYKKGTGPMLDMSVPADLAKNIRLQGQTCDPATDVCEGTGACVDRVCCENACADPCKACNIDGQLGNCVAVAVGKMPEHGTCNAADPTTCGHDGTCDGMGACQLYIAGTKCGAGDCTVATGNFQPPPECDGKGTCQTLAAYNCDPYRCDGTMQCFGPMCSDSLMCAGTNSCTNMSCGLLPLGRLCGLGTQCLSGNCVDGVCCDGTCTGQCAACDLLDGTGNKGHCQQVTGAPRGGRAACGGAGVCAGTCATQLAACDFAGGTTSCGTTSCTNSTTLHSGVCNGSGTCNSSDNVCANHLACAANMCKASCTLDVDCDSRYFCNTGNNTCVSKCTNGTQDNGESDIDCGGPNCAPCIADKTCGVHADCVSGTCSTASGGRCRQAVGPPGWDTVSQASMPYGRAMHQLVSAGGKLYAIGGTEWYDYMGGPLVRDSKSIAVYTPSYLTSTNGVGSWAIVDNAISGAAVDPAAIALADGTIHEFGGYSGAATAQHQFGAAPPLGAGTAMLVALSGLRAAFASDGNIYLVGGGTVPGTATACVNSNYKFTPPNTFVVSTSISGQTRCNFALVPTVDGRLYGYFGRQANNGTTGLTGYSSWKPGDANWVTNAGGISGMGFNNTGAPGSDGRAYLFGGETGGALIATDRNFLKHNEAAGFIFMPALPTGLSRAAAAKGPDGRIWLSGGVTAVTGSPVPSEYVSVWGPKFTVSTVTPTKGGITLCTLKNFAAAATVSVYLDGTAGAPLASTPAVTDSSGNFAGTLTVTIPAATTSGAHQLIALDPKSEYPVTVPITIP